MIWPFRSLLGRFAREEDGNSTVEFVIIVPVYLSMMVFSVELGLITMRNTMLERGLDIAVRDLRLGTGTFQSNTEEEQEATHNLIKQTVCNNSIVLVNCENKLQLEMVVADPFAFNSLDTEVKCTDRPEDAAPVRFSTGTANQLMLLRACYKYEPLFPEGVLGSALSTNAEGEAAVVSLTAFVQEPL
ncbi:TadE/TadG family type IV pilus assembly protein [Roseovarius rhodophyticola]|uniref:TadE/TadG family type IV pilus assembly protein n=1 Tax=Roseovarius rhodophyticola TaxID=3080827 RepID=A0ABZ2TCB7_9RHOB|nr:TadE/TadG family type IV pilus assembly protein [Roseovarius sp. W115]MDV2931043.1 TadE/TadG family type IV pilus assembly protein [Roseovarius sp. W115]